MHTFIDSIGDGPGALVLTGEPGIGKSTLWRTGLRIARERGHEVLQCRPVESEAQLAFTSLSDLLTELANDSGLLEPGLFRYLGDAIEAKIARGRLDEASALIDTTRVRADALDRPWLHLIVGRGQGLLEAARGNLDNATDVLTAALDHDRTGQPFERTRTQLVLGTVHRRNRQKRAARDELRAASAEFARLGARVWVERAQSELSRVGGRHPNDELTPTERQVAELIAAGRSYREAAAELFISPKTVQWNLSKVYSKLGIRSRAELPGRLRKG